MKSLRFRLLLGTLCWIVFTLIVAGFALSQLFQQHISAQLSNELLSQLDQLTALVEVDENITLTGTPSDPRFSRPLSGLYWQIERGSDVLRSRSLWDQKLELPAASDQLTSLYSNQGGQLLARVRQVQVNEQILSLAVATDASTLHSPVERFVRELSVALLILGAGLALAAFVQVYLGLTPLQRLRDALSQVRQGKRPTLPDTFPSELSPLVQEFNAVLLHNQNLVERARTQAGNLAHGLKTPLSILANAAAQENSELAKLVQHEVEQARQQVNYQLNRAKAAATRKHAKRTPLLATVQALSRVLKKVHQEKPIQMQIEIAESLFFQGEEADLQEMLGNLLDNAYKWAASRVNVSADNQQHTLRICIEDDGQGIDDKQKETVLQRGVRADERMAGSGLGLHIVSDLAHEYQGELVLHDSPLGGVKAVLSLPVRQE